MYPSDQEDSSDEEDGKSGIPRQDSFGDESAPLLQTQRSIHSQMSKVVKGTSESKAFFMLTKAFVGTGVLFLPVILIDLEGVFKWGAGV